MNNSYCKWTDRSKVCMCWIGVGYPPKKVPLAPKPLVFHPVLKKRAHKCRTLLQLRVMPSGTRIPQPAHCMLGLQLGMSPQ